MRMARGAQPSGHPGWTLAPVSSLARSAAPVIHICSSTGQFPQLQALFLSLATTHRSSKLILVLWQRTVDLGHVGVGALSAGAPKVWSASCIT